MMFDDSLTLLGDNNFYHCSAITDVYYNGTLAEWKATHQVTRKGTGLTVEDRILLKEMEAYNGYVARQEAMKLPYESFEEWADKRGYQVNRVRPSSTGSTVTRTDKSGGFEL